MVSCVFERSRSLWLRRACRTIRPARFGDDEDDVPLHVLQVTMNSRLVRELFTEKTTHSHRGVQNVFRAVSTSREPQVFQGELKEIRGASTHATTGVRPVPAPSERAGRSCC